MAEPKKQGDSLPRRRLGGRSARIMQAVFESALMELSLVGYTGFSIANVARRAEVHETTIYRRWQQKENLIIEACDYFVDQNMPVPDTGKLQKDLKIALTNLVKLIQTPVGEVLVALGFSARSIPEFSGRTLGFLHTRIGIGQKVIEQAVARGEWPKDYDSGEVFATLVGPIFARYFLLQEPITPKMIENRVAAVLALRDRS